MNKILLVDTNIILGIRANVTLGRMITDIEEQYEGVCVLPPHTMRMVDHKVPQEARALIEAWIGGSYARHDESLEAYHKAMVNSLKVPEYGAVPYDSWKVYISEHPLVKSGRFHYQDREDLVFILSSMDWAMRVRPGVEINFVSSDVECIGAIEQLPYTQIRGYAQVLAKLAAAKDLNLKQEKFEQAEMRRRAQQMEVK
jgi:hypothetical protein